MVTVQYNKIMVNRVDMHREKMFLNKGNDFLIEGEPVILGNNRKDIFHSGSLQATSSSHLPPPALRSSWPLKTGTRYGVFFHSVKPVFVISHCDCLFLKTAASYLKKLLTKPQISVNSEILFKNRSLLKSY